MKGRLLTEEPYNYEAALSSIWIVEPVLVIKCMSGNSPPIHFPCCSCI